LTKLERNKSPKIRNSALVNCDPLDLSRVRTHPGIPGIYLILIALLESPGIVLDFHYTPGKGNSPLKHFENNS